MDVRGLGLSCSGRPPELAVCIAGAARSFASPLLLAALRRNFLEAFGARARLFVQLKLVDTPKVEGVQRLSFGSHHGDAAKLFAALRQPWLAAVVEEAAIIDGPGSFQGVGVVPTDNLRRLVFPSNASTWQDHRALLCKRARFLTQGTNEERLVLNHLGQAWCRSAVQRAEARLDRRFELVAFTRPDLVWWQPLLPWCRWPIIDRPLISCNHSGCDSAWIAPREYASVLLGQADLHRDCSWRLSASCCSTPEGLLQYAKRVARCHAQLRDGKLRSRPATSFERCANPDESPAEMDIFSAQEPHGKPLTSIVRSAAACDEALSPAWHDAGGVSAAQRRGVSVATATRLRAVFGVDRMACVAALS